MTSKVATQTTRRTIRMTKYPDQTLDGYVFTDMEHARKWLSQPFVQGKDVRLELLEIGEAHTCPKCGGSGLASPKLTVIGPIELKNVLT